MKKAISLFAALLLTFACLTGCGAGDGRGDGGLRIVTTIFPVYDWVMNILGPDPADIEVTMLLDTGVDLHSFQPSAADILAISTCDLFVYVGGESDEWAEDALRETSNPDRIVINLLDALGSAAKEEETVEGMQEEHGHEDGHDEDDHDEDDHDEDHDHAHGEGEVEYDEHVWLSLVNAAALVKTLQNAIETLEPAHAETWRSRADAYAAKLNALDDEYRNAVSQASCRTLLFGDRFPFRYLTDDYGLSYYAAFAGCSAETEASFETITFLANKVDELGLRAVMTIEGTDHRIAETVVRSTRTKDQRILTLDSMQSVTAKDAAEGETYLAIMEQNLAVLKEALK